MDYHRVMVTLPLGGKNDIVRSFSWSSTFFVLERTRVAGQASLGKGEDSVSATISPLPSSNMYTAFNLHRAPDSRTLRYEIGEEHPIRGRTMPRLDVQTRRMWMHRAPDPR